MAVVYPPVSALALRLVVTLTSAFLFQHEALYETSDQLLVAADLPSFPTAHCRVAEDSRIQDADDVGCVCTCVLERDENHVRSVGVSLYILLLLLLLRALHDAQTVTSLHRPHTSFAYSNLVASARRNWRNSRPTVGSAVPAARTSSTNFCPRSAWNVMRHHGLLALFWSMHVARILYTSMETISQEGY